MEQVEEQRAEMIAVEFPATTGCTYPARPENYVEFACGKRIRAIYVNTTGWLYHRCYNHDGPKTQAWAAEHGFKRHYARQHEDGEACGLCGKSWPCR